MVWFQDSFQQEYIFTLKQNFLKGFTGALMQILKNFIGMVFVPVCIYSLMKRKAHDTANYYNVRMVAQPGSPNYNNSNLSVHTERVGEFHRKYRKDFLGRSNIYLVYINNFI
jgi:hypothetical protein